MGLEMSFHKNRAVSVYDDGMNLQIRNNFHPLHFHPVHGENVKLFDNNTVACREEGFCKGIVFSDRPVLVNERVYIRFVQMSTNWSGAVRIGFTAHDPVSLKSKLPRYACPDLSSMSGNWAKAVAEQMVKKDSVLYYFVDQKGDVHYGIDSQELGIFFGSVNINHKLWAVLDIYGNTVAIEFLDSKAFIPQLPPCEASGVNNYNLPINLATNKPRNAQAGRNASMYFHSVHGRNVTLESNRTVAARSFDFPSQAYIFTERPLQLNEEFYIQIEKTTSSKGVLVYGVTSCDPSSLVPKNLPENAQDLLDRPEYWIVQEDSNSYAVGDIICFCINNEGELTVNINENFKSVLFYVDSSLPLRLFFNIVGTVSKVRSLGSSVNDPVDDITNNINNLKVSLPSKNERNDNQTFSECVICFEEPVNCALYRCGHMCMCYNCALKLRQEAPSSRKCPICRELIVDVIKVYR